MSINHSFLRKVRIIGYAEGVSTLVLYFIGVPLKHLYEMPMTVKISGPIHGVLFTLLSVMLWMAIDRVPLPKKLAVYGIIAALFPFGPFIMDRKLHQIDIEEVK